MPAVKSRYSLPSLSHTRTPSPRTRATGARLAVVIRCLSAHSISVFVSVMFLGLAGEGPEGGLHLGEHAPVDDRRLDQPLRVPLGQGRDQPPVLAVDAGHVGQMDELL